MNKPPGLFEGEEMNRDEQLAAVNYSAGHIQVAVAKLTAFVIVHLDDEPEIVAAARRVNDGMNELCGRLTALSPQPWDCVEAEDLTM
jgi:hypothetical protein